MAEQLLFHHAQGQTAGFHAVADGVRAAGPRWRRDERRSPIQTRLCCLIGKRSSGGGMWTHFPDRLTYRFTEVRRLESE